MWLHSRGNSALGMNCSSLGPPQDTLSGRPLGTSSCVDSSWAAVLARSPLLCGFFVDCSFFQVMSIYSSHQCESQVKYVSPLPTCSTTVYSMGHSKTSSTLGAPPPPLSWLTLCLQGCFSHIFSFFSFICCCTAFCCREYCAPLNGK